MVNLFFEILEYLADGKFHSGETMAKHFNVSRVSIWNAIAKAEGIGVKIFSVRGKGYKLQRPVSLLNESKIKNAMGEEGGWFNIKVLDTVDSTNNYLVKAVSSDYPHASVVATNIQTQGKGRRGRQWQSALGESLTFSFLWRFTQGAAALSGLSLAVGVALIRALKKININKALLKWPNDVLIFDGGQYKKLAGILIELQGDTDGQSAAIIGVGLNLNISKNQFKKIDQPAIDINNLLPDQIDSNFFMAIIIKELANVLASFEAEQFKLFKDEWLSYHAFQDKPINIILGNSQTISGKAINISDTGALIVSTDEGIKSFASGEVSVRSTE
ncbi:MAG: biotin--[acetyl-CoA-carboxylase] ligase [Nitrosomonadales bacterium]|nr:biotin--[acetyl-CoA-carboxylase] ligase [Nitrosomonadales bacterium]MBT6818253.1 biotin--[acetyl-CoA-carboxylase] ligase [Nitrosomonadales bacterium]MBT7482150.1 biotin--[acetyl-CoA-carboxylase] ligase [Nitrosomonadales bacterium]